MRRLYSIIWLASSGVAVISALLVVVMIVVNLTPLFLAWQLPLGPNGGVVCSDDAVFVAALASGRIYKFDLDGKVLRWFDNRGGSLYISQRDQHILVKYSGREWLLDDPEFRVHDHPGVTADVEYTWWGNPILVVRREHEVTRSPLQPWYLTVVQIPYPGALLSVAMIACILLWGWARVRMRNGVDEGSSRSLDTDNRPQQALTAS